MRRDDVYRRQVEAAAKLLVGFGPDEPSYALLVDAGPLMAPEDEHHPRYFTLHAVDDGEAGMWVHGPSGSYTTLPEHLRSIACLFLDRADRRAAVAGGDDPEAPEATDG